MTTDFSLYDAAQHADDMWQKKLIEVYGRHVAGQARYDLRGQRTPELEALYQAKIAADAAWAAECQKDHPQTYGPRIKSAKQSHAAVMDVVDLRVVQTRDDSRFRVVKVTGKVR